MPPLDLASARLLIAEADQPIGWAEFQSGDPQGTVFRFPDAALLPDAGRLRAWAITAADRRRWCEATPGLCDPTLPVDSLGPGARSLWLSGGSRDGVRVGDVWWMRLRGQPVARFDIRLVEESVAYGRLTPLVADLRVRPGDRFSLWGRRAETAESAWDRSPRSAVGFVETADDATFAWVPIPPGTPVLTEPRVNFYRAGQYVAHGVTERRDDRFLHVRIQPEASRGPVRIGDEARIRRPLPRSAQSAPAPVEDDDAPAEPVPRPLRTPGRSLRARIFETSPFVLINAGEADGLREGDVGAVYQGPTRLGGCVVRRVQPNYSVIAAHPAGAVLDCERLDEARFGAQPATPRTIGQLVGILGQTIVLARPTLPDPLPLATPLRVAGDDGRTVGVAVLVEGGAGAAFGFVLPESLLAPLRPGMVLVTMPDLMDE